MSDEQLTTKVALLEQNHLNLMEKIEEILERFDKLESKLDYALEKKAGIWVEGVIKWFGICVGSGILGYVGLQLIKVIEKL